MAQNLIQTQEQKLQQIQKLTQQQMLQVRLTEMPLPELEESVKAEIDDNPALEVVSPDDAQPVYDASDNSLFDNDEGNGTQDSSNNGHSNNGNNNDDIDGDAFGNHDNDIDDDAFDSHDEQFNREQDREERASALDDALEGIGRDDEMPTAFQAGGTYADNGDGDSDSGEMVWGDSSSFYNKLNEQVGEQDITPKQRDIMEYIIGSLDDDGLLRKSADSLCDELELFQNVECTPEEVKEMMQLLKTFDPAGIGAHDLRECLILQLRRRPKSRMRDLAIEILTYSYNDFIARHWEVLKKNHHITDDDLDGFRHEIMRLNPKPGASLGEAEGRSMQQITPDFIVDTLDDGTIKMYLNAGDVPELKVSPTFADMVETYRNNRKGMSRQEKEALLYAKEKVDKAQGYIDAIRQRRATLTKTMRAIIDWQRKFFLDGDEADLKPMVLKDIAAKTGLDISTVSRVCNVKYVQTNWGIFPLKFFFNISYTNENGEELSTRNIKATLKEIVEGEDKKAPYSDDMLSKLMKEKGYPIARRTVSKYREQLAIPSAKQRRE